MNSPKQNPFGDALLCPVCFCEYDGRIMQCHQGHAVCEKCYSKLKECPHCRSVYLGTRNFVLEELMTKLKGLTFKNSGNENGQATDEAEPTTVTSTTKTTNEAPVTADQPLSEGNFLSLLQEMLENVIVYPPPVQGKGQYICRIIGCAHSLPICRLLNHLRCYHRDLLLETREDLRDRPFTNNFNIPSQSYCKAFNIYKYGLFFIIINVAKNSGTTSIKGWIQCACPNNDARNFRFTLKITYGNVHAIYTDLVYGAQSDAVYIQGKQQCLTCSARSNSRNMEVEVKIDRNVGPKNTQRHSNTLTSILQIHQPNIQAAVNTATNTAHTTTEPRSNRRRNRNRRR